MDTVGLLQTYYSHDTGRFISPIQQVWCHFVDSLYLMHIVQFCVH